MQSADFLLEIGTEELPPRSLTRLSRALAASLESALAEARLEFSSVERFATPRRLAVLVRELATHQTSQSVEKRGPSVAVAFDEQGQPTRAAEGFARSCGVSVADLERMKTDKGEWLVYRTTDAGQRAAQVIPSLVERSAASLPIPKRMRWGDGDATFVRPVHWLVALHGDQVVEMGLFGIQSDRYTQGHRFHYPHAIELTQARDYQAKLADPGRVIAGFEQRREIIRQQIQAEAEKLGGRVRMDEALLDEVTALVEWPVGVAGHFEKRFLELPDEVLISTLQEHQRYFPVYGSGDTLMPAFITIANIESKSVDAVRRGNERVVRPRLADALFFWEQDRKQPLDKTAAGLARVLFQKGLGSLADKTERIRSLAESVAEAVGADRQAVRRAATLSKADLLTDMVGEFPDLQGVMGHRYALAGGEPAEVARALEEQYLPRQAGDALPTSATGKALALADRMDTLCGIFSLGKKPTGEKDPFALRRAALGILRILVEAQIDLDLRALIRLGLDLQPVASADAVADSLAEFFLERLRAYYASRGVASEVFNSVAAVQSSHPLDFQHRLEAVSHFLTLPEAERLAAAHKRVRNILRQAEGQVDATVAPELLQDAQEKQLYEALKEMEETHAGLMQVHDYDRALVTLADMGKPVDAFFDTVMVMDEDARLRSNRLALLARLNALCCSVADISCLPG